MYYFESFKQMGEFGKSTHEALYYILTGQSVPPIAHHHPKASWTISPINFANILKGDASKLYCSIYSKNNVSLTKYYWIMWLHMILMIAFHQFSQLMCSVPAHPHPLLHSVVFFFFFQLKVVGHNLKCIFLRSCYTLKKISDLPLIQTDDLCMWCQC